MRDMIFNTQATYNIFAFLRFHFCFCLPARETCMHIAYLLGSWALSSTSSTTSSTTALPKRDYRSASTSSTRPEKVKQSCQHPRTHEHRRHTVARCTHSHRWAFSLEASRSLRRCHWSMLRSGVDQLPRMPSVSQAEMVEGAFKVRYR